MWRQRQAGQRDQGLAAGEIIQARQVALAGKSETEIPADRFDLLTMLIMARDEEGRPLSDREILDECLTIFVAGHETTAVATTWTMAMLLQHPADFERLKWDIETELQGSRLSVDKIKSLPYLTQVINESMRRFPPAHGFARTPLESFTIDGHTFNRGDIVIISTHALHHQADFYPDPFRFDPDRFGPDKPPPQRYAFLPFGAGPRICIGNAFATLEMQVILTTLIQSLEIDIVPGQEIEPVIMLTLRPKDGLKIVAHKRASPTTASLDIIRRPNQPLGREKLP